MRREFRDIVAGWTMTDGVDDLTRIIERSAEWAKKNAPLQPDEEDTVRMMIEAQVARADPWLANIIDPQAAAAIGHKTPEPLAVNRERTEKLAHTIMHAVVQHYKTGIAERGLDNAHVYEVLNALASTAGIVIAGTTDHQKLVLFLADAVMGQIEATLADFAGAAEDGQ